MVKLSFLKKVLTETEAKHLSMNKSSILNLRQGTWLEVFNTRSDWFDSWALEVEEDLVQGRVRGQVKVLTDQLDQLVRVLALSRDLEEETNGI